MLNKEEQLFIRIWKMQEVEFEGIVGLCRTIIISFYREICIIMLRYITLPRHIGGVIMAEATILDKVEDDHSGQPKNYKDTGQRMYLWDFTKWVHDDSGLSSIVLKNHMLSLYEDGSIKIEILLGSGPITVFSKSGMTATI